MNSELPASAPGVVDALPRMRFLATTTTASFELVELAFESVRRCLPSVFFGSLELVRRGTPLDPVALTDDEVESDILPLSRACMGEKGD